MANCKGYALLSRIIIVLGALLFLLPTSALAITYQQLALQVATATQDTVIVLDSDLHQGNPSTTPGFVILENNNGAHITIDGANHSIQGLSLANGTYTIRNATIYGDDDWSGIWVEVPKYADWLVNPSSWGIVDLTLESSVTVNKRRGSTPYETMLLGALPGNSSIRLQSDAKHDENEIVEIHARTTTPIVLQGTSSPVRIRMSLLDVLVGANGLPVSVTLGPGSAIYDYSRGDAHPGELYTIAPNGTVWGSIYFTLSIPRSASTLPKTGDGFPIGWILAVMGASLMGIGWLCIRARISRMLN